MDKKSIGVISLVSAIALTATLIAVPGLLTSANTFAYNLTHGEKLAIMRYSKASYCEPVPLLYWNCGSDCDYHNYVTDVQVVIDDKMKSQGWCGFNPERNEIIVAFRGTSNIKNWISDFKAFPVDYEFCNGCKIHKGFKESLAPLMTKIETCVVGLVKSHPTATIIATGHSLGGAMAVLQAASLYRLYPNRNTIKLVTFGSPRVGNPAFASYMNSIIQNQARIISKDDVVPHVPWLSMGFIHSGPEIWYYDAKNPSLFKICDVYDISKENENCSDSVWSINYSAKDHLDYFEDYTGCSASKQLALAESLEIQESFKPIVDEKIMQDQMLMESQY